MSKREIRRPSNTVTRGQTTAFMRASSVQVLLTDRYMQKIRKEGGENSRKYLGKRLVKQLARKAAAARPKKRKQTAQKTFVFDEGKGLSSEKQQYDTTSAINEVRSYVDTWRALPNPSQWQVTPETARLLQHWRKSEGRSIREGPSNPMRLSLIGRVEADEEILSHRALPSGIPGLLGLQLNETIVVSLGR